MKLSIITINLNNREGLERTIQSVLSQIFIDFEYIIIDGGSTDGSVELIHSLNPSLPQSFKWISEPDTGVYNAMNKGILMANGEYCLFLNSGDWLADENVVGDFYAFEGEGDIILGNMYLWDNHKVTLLQTKDKEIFGFEHFYFGGNLPHQATFTKRKLFDLYGLYNENFKIASDFEFLVITLVTKGATYNHFDRIISYYDLSGISSQKEFSDLHQTERDEIFKTHVPLVYKSYKILCDQLQILQLHESEYREYMNLKNGRLGFLIRLILLLKEKRKQLT
jgi:glycosyltransferase involved in cell wall biosynthesis